MSEINGCSIFKNKPCIVEKKIQDGSKKLRQKLQKAKVCCNNETYKDIYKYFKPGKARNRDLLIALQEFYKTKKTEDINFTLSLNQFIHMFPRDTALKDNNFKRQHIFEQICRLLLFFNYDNGIFGNTKEFYPKLEDYNSGTKGLKKTDLMEERINEGSKAGSVDIFFKLLDNGKGPNKDDFFCNQESKENQLEKDTYILVQNKYYDNESTDIAKYDAPKIFSRASKILDKVDKFKVVLMVNSRKVLNDKLKSFDKEGIDILGVEDIEPWFQKLLQNLHEKDISSFIKSDKTSFKKLEPRFHQKLFIDSSLRHYQEQKRRKFIWGAVPRSGKSYIIGGMVSKRAEMGSNNDVVIIMGAKAETISQFTELFDFKKGGFTDFKDFGFSTQDKVNEKSGKNIYLISQEFFKMNKLKLKKEESTRLNFLLKKKSKTTNETIELKELQSKQKQFSQTPYEFKKEFKEGKFKNLFKTGNKIDIYFDEIHKGGSTDKSMEILQAFVKEDMVDLLFMVTATFAKPSIAYKDFIDDKSPVILQWGYEEQQLMKNINVNEVNLQIVKEQRNNDIDRQVIDKILIEYNEKYGIDYLRVLADEYKKHPELVLINPQTLQNIDNFFEERDITDTLFALDCKAIDYDNKSNKKIFQNSDPVDKLLNFLTSENGLYYYLKHVIEEKMKIDVYNDKPTQLWFLPITGLFKDSDCVPTGIPKTYKQEDVEEMEEGEEFKKQGLPHIEPVTRGIALALMENDFFKENYNVLIVHNDGNLFEKSGIKSDSIKCSSDKENKGKPLVQVIKEYENKCHQSEGGKKGLIILTGTKLRLGVSLPCADIALNFDNVQSIDSNYQTMFRVLTERNDNSKKYGYYVDFNLDRTKSFIYDFALIYSNKMKQNNSFNEIKESLSNIYELFNFNGLSFGKTKDFKEVLNMYKNLNDRLGINDENLKNMYIKNYERTIGKIMLKYDISKLKEINKLVKGLFKEDSKVKHEDKGTSKEGGKKHKPPGETQGNPENTGEEPEKEEEEKDIDIVKNLRIFLPSIVALLSLFSSKPRTGESDFDCNNLEDCLDKAIESIEPLHSLCDCSSEPVLLHPIGCYIQKFKKISKDKLKKLLEKIKEIIFTDEFNEVRQHLNLLYNNIRMDFKLTGGGKKFRTKKLMKGGARKMRGGTRKLIDDMNNKEIMAKIQQYLPIRKEMKDKHGEVFTPYELIKEMMDKLNEIDPSVFKNPHLKWLDPANGIGNFPMVVFKMLNEGLKTYNKGGLDLRDDSKRKEHIIKNMLYMVELQADNVMVSKKIFGKDANIFCGSFLTEDKKEINPIIIKKMGVSKFDVIMGNPPFNDKQEHIGKKGGGDSLWPYFVEHSLGTENFLNNKGFLVFVHPASWRKPESEKSKNKGLFNLMAKENTIKYLEIHNTEDGMKVFNAGTRYDWYVISKQLNKSITKIKDEKGIVTKVDLNTFDFLPNFEINFIKKLLKKKDEEGVNVIFNSYQFEGRRDWVKEVSKPEGKFIHPLIHSTPKTGPRIFHSSTKTPKIKNFVPMFGVKKVIFGDSGVNNVIIDEEGDFGLTQHAIGLEIRNRKEGKILKKVLESDVFNKKIIESTSFSNFQIDWRMFTYFKKDFWKEFVSESSGQSNSRTGAAGIKTRKNKKTRKRTKRK